MTAVTGADRIVVRGAFAAAAGFFVRFFARVAFLAVAGRLFGAALFGAYTVGTAVVEIGVIAGGLGTRWMLFQWLDEHRTDGPRPVVHALFDSALLVAAASTLLAGATMISLAALPSSLIAPNTAAALFWLAPMIVVQALIELMLAATRWGQVMRYEVVGKSVVQPYAALIVALVAYALGERTYGLVAAYVAGSLAAALYAVAALRRTFGSFALSHYVPDLAGLWSRRGAILANGLSDTIEGFYTRLDVYAVGILLGESAVGIYGVAKQVSISIRQIRQSFDGMLIPLTSRTLADTGPRETRLMLARLGRLILSVELPAVLLFFGAGAELLALFGPVFAAGYWALCLLGVAETVQGAFGVGDLLLVFRRPAVGAVITAGSSLVGAFAIALLAPRWWLGGAGGAMLLAYTVRAVARRYAIRRLFALAPPIWPFAWPLALAALGAVVTWTILLLRISGSSTLATALGLAAYAAGMALWHLRTRSVARATSQPATEEAAKTLR